MMNETFLSEVKEYIGVSANDTDSTIKDLINTADLFLCSSISKDYDKTDSRAKTLIKIIVNDLYTNREYTDKRVSQNTRKLIENMILQLKLEMRNKQNGI